MGIWSWFWLLVPPAVFLIAAVAYYILSRGEDSSGGG